MFVFSFDVGRSMFDVRCSSLETSPYGINVTCECFEFCRDGTIRMESSGKKKYNGDAE